MPEVIANDSQFERVECPVCAEQSRHILLFRIQTKAEIIYGQAQLVVAPAAISVEIKCQRCNRLIVIGFKLPVEFIEPSEVELG